jgi:peroxiredoxin
MALSIETPAPDFTLSSKSTEGLQRISLSQHRGHSNVLLLFVPLAFTEVCTKEFCDVTQSLTAYASLNAVVYGISGDSPFAQEAWAQKNGISIPLLSDYDHAVARAYGVAYDNFLPEIGLGISGVAKRSAFLIDRQGIIRYAESHNDPHQIPDFAKIQAQLSELEAAHK